jgi:hypothetical protein
VTTHDRLRELMGDDALRVVEGATKATRWEVVFDPEDSTRTLEGRLVRGAAPLTEAEVSTLREVLLDEATYVWELATRHRDIPLVAFELILGDDACAVFFDERGLKIRVAMNGRYGVRDVAAGSPGLFRIAALAAARTVGEP